MTTRISLQGSCHCGAIGIEYTTCQLPSSVVPRACDCSFCRKHGAAYVSDPSGALAISCADIHALTTYRQGSENARFLMCSGCGVLIAVCFDKGSSSFAAINALCLDRYEEFPAALCSSPQKLSAAEKTARWSTLWIPAVSFQYGP